MSSLVLEEQRWELENLVEDEDEIENRKNQNNVQDYKIDFHIEGWSWKVKRLLFMFGSNPN